MSKTTIEWTQETWNTTTGCTKFQKNVLTAMQKLIHNTISQSELININ